MILREVPRAKDSAKAGRRPRAGAQGARYIIRGGLQGRERLRVLARAMHPTTAALFDRIGIRPGMRCLDVGCGGGDVTRELGRRVVPGGHVVGLDLDAAKLEIARREAAADGGHVESARLLRQLLPPLERRLRPLRPALHPDRPGAWVDPNIGPRLPSLLASAGCTAVRVNVVQPAGIAPDGHEGDVKRVTALTLENIADAAVAEGLATRDELASVLDELYRLAADTTTLLAIPRIVQAWGHRPRP